MGRRNLTLPLVEPSCADFPLTLKVTPLGALDLISRLAATGQFLLLINKTVSDHCTGCSMVEIFVEELAMRVLVKREEGRGQEKTYIVGRLGNIGEGRN